MELDPNATYLGMVHERCDGPGNRRVQESICGVRLQKGAFRKDLQRRLADWDKGHWHLNALRIARVYGEIGDNDQAFEWLDNAIQLRSTALFWLYDGDNALRKDPRFADVKHKMGVDYLR